MFMEVERESRLITLTVPGDERYGKSLDVYRRGCNIIRWCIIVK